MQNFSKFLIITAIALTPLSALADSTTGEVKGAYAGKVMCQSGRKVAEFKGSGGNPTFSTSEAIKRRIDTLTWHGSSEGSSFSDREKEKTDLQKALKALKSLDCDAPPPSNEPEEPKPLPPALLPHPD